LDGFSKKLFTVFNGSELKQGQSVVKTIEQCSTVNPYFGLYESAVAPPSLNKLKS